MSLIEDDRVSEMLRHFRTQAQADSFPKVAVIHTTPFRACVKRGDTPDPFDAYGGSARLGEFLAELARERTVTCRSGHEHTPLDMTVNGIRVLRAPVGYLRGRRCDGAEKAEEILGVFVL